MKVGRRAVKTSHELRNELCREGCLRSCHLQLSAADIIVFRGLIVNSIYGVVTSARIKAAIRALLSARIDVGSLVRSKNQDFVRVDNYVCGKFICRWKFIDLLGMTSLTFNTMVSDIVTGDPYLHNRTGGSGYLADNTLRALARMGVRASVHGQFSPLEGGVLMLDRAESKTHFMRANAVGSTVREPLLLEYLGFRVKRKGADLFMRCDSCKTLMQDWQRLRKLLVLAAKSHDRKKGPGTGRGFTAEAFRRQIISTRKELLFSHRAAYYKNLNKNTGHTTADACVPDEDTEITRFCELLNGRDKCSLRPPLRDFTIKPINVRDSEFADFDEDSLDAFLSGQLNEDDLAAPLGGMYLDDHDDMREVNWDRLPNHREVRNDEMEDDGGGDGMQEACSSFRAAAMRLHLHDPVRRRMLGLLTAAERIMDLRRFHNQHFTAERLMCYSAFETGATCPTTCLVLVSDGMSKDKTKLPKPKGMGKEDATNERLDCYLTCIQRAVPSMICGTTQRDRVKMQSESARRKKLQELKEAAAADGGPVDHTVHEEILRGEQQTLDEDAGAASSFAFENHDFVFPFGGSAVTAADALVSTLLDLLRSDHVTVVPPVIAIILDNATTNKSIHAIRAFGLILELIPGLQEIHLMFSTVGHTHNSVDAHFGNVCDSMNGREIGTPTDLVELLDTMKSTYGHIDFDLYKFSHDLNDGDLFGAMHYKWVLDQHHFLIFKDSHGDIKMDNKAFLRFAEPLSNRVTQLANSCRTLLPRTDMEKLREGIPVFLPGPEGRELRASFAKTIMPYVGDAAERKFVKACKRKLRRLLGHAQMSTPKRLDDLAKIRNRPAASGPSLFHLCFEIGQKTRPESSQDVVLGTRQEMAVHQHLRLRNRTFKFNPLQVEVGKNLKGAQANLTRELFGLLMEDPDDHGLANAVLDKIKNSGRPRLLNRLKDVLRDVAGQLGRGDDEALAGDQPAHAEVAEAMLAERDAMEDEQLARTPTGPPRRTTRPRQPRRWYEDECVMEGEGDDMMDEAPVRKRDPYCNDDDDGDMNGILEKVRLSKRPLDLGDEDEEEDEDDGVSDVEVGSVRPRESASDSDEGGVEGGSQFGRGRRARVPKKPFTPK